MKNLEFINVSEDSYTLFEYCQEHDFFTGDYDEFIESGADLSFFEGDPDMIKIDGQVGYFALCGDKVFYYFDSFEDDKVRGILRDFFQSGSVGNFGYFSKFMHGFKSLTTDGLRKGESCLWDAWERLQTAIAYRGGAGYFYDIIPLRTAA